MTIWRVSILLILMLSGCHSPNIIIPEKIDAITQIQLAVPSDIDDILSKSVDDFANKVDELSNGKIKVNIVKSNNTLGDLNNTAHMSIVRDVDIIHENPDLRFLHLPFIFDSSEEYFAFLSGRDDTSIISRILKNKYNSDMVGTYIYQTVYLLSRSDFKQDLNLFNPISAIKSILPKKMYNILGFIINLVDTEDELMESFRDSTAEHMEVYTTTDVSDVAMSQTVSIGLTEHRYTSHFLLLGNAMDIELDEKLIIQQAYAETINHHIVARREQWENYYMNLLKRRRLQIYTIGDFSSARKLCNINYLRYYTDLEIKDFIWNEIRSMIIIT